VTTNSCALLYEINYILTFKLLRETSFPFVPVRLNGNMADPYKTVVVGGGLKLKGATPKAAASPAAKAYVGEGHEEKDIVGLRVTVGFQDRFDGVRVCAAVRQPRTRTGSEQGR